MIGDSDDLVKYRISRSLETLREADAMIQNGFWNASVNRIYYACYYAVSGLLLKKNIETNSHKGIRQMFGLHFVQSGIVSKEDGRFFSDLYLKSDLSTKNKRSMTLFYKGIGTTQDIQPFGQTAHVDLV